MASRSAAAWLFAVSATAKSRIRCSRLSNMSALLVQGRPAAWLFPQGGPEARQGDRRAAAFMPAGYRSGVKNRADGGGNCRARRDPDSHPGGLRARPAARRRSPDGAASWPGAPSP